jgi:hypothetical protein
MSRLPEFDEYGYHHLSEEETAAHHDDRLGWAPMCTETTLRGKPCKNPVFTHQEWHWDEETGRPLLDAEALATFREGLCYLHRRLALSSKKPGQS